MSENQEPIVPKARTKPLSLLARARKARAAATKAAQEAEKAREHFANLEARVRDRRRRELLGDVTEELMQRDPDLQRRVQEHAAETLKDADDRKAFGLEPLPDGVGSERIWLKVSLAEKDEAKKFGARWDKKERKWYVTVGTDLGPLERWR